MRRIACTLLALLVSSCGAAPPSEPKSSPSPTSNARSTVAPGAATLSTVFSPVRAPQRKTMGLLQRSFLDLVEQSEQTLQVALVIDGSDSMAAELTGVRQTALAMLADLRRYRGDRVEFALVIYRDSGSPSGEVTVPLQAFTSSDEAIQQALDQLKPESGAPYFHELVDVGLHRAIDQLPWSSDPQASRWIMLFGDAPPYAEDYKDAKLPQARRHYATELLVALAVRKGIRVNSVLCTSGPEEHESYTAALEETRAFMNALATGTDGLMLDLSYPDIQQALIEAQRKPDPSLIALDRITRTDLDEARARLGTTSTTKELPTVRIAVVPHLPLNQMSFDPQEPAVQVATALRKKFGELARVRVTSPIDIQRQLRRLRADGVADEQQIRALAARLNVDYVVWGQLQPNQQIQTAAYRRQDGQSAWQVSYGHEQQGELAQVFLAAASRDQASADQQLVSLLKQLEGNNQANTERLAATPATTRLILTAWESLDQALGLTVGTPESEALLSQARDQCRLALQAEPRHPLVHWLDANAAYNQASARYARGEREQAEAAMREMLSSLRAAYRERRSITNRNFLLEVEADYLLLVDRKADQARERYQTLAQTNVSDASRRRAHWMLSGISAGDWGVPPDEIDVAGAREHLVALMAGWEESQEAESIRTWLRWDPETGQTRFNYLPRPNQALASVQ